MDITVNAKPHSLSEGTTLADLIKELGLADAPCAAEVNQALVPKRRHTQHPLSEGDVIELVTLVGGG